MTLPSWLGARKPVASPCPCCGVSVGSSFAEKTLLGVSALARDSLDSSLEAARPGLVQSLDPRAKLVGALALMIGVATSRSLVGIGALAVVVPVLAAASGLSLGGFLRRTWLVVPLFTAALALPALLNATTPGPALLTLGATPGFLRPLGWPPVLTITTTGIRAAVQLVLRVGTSVSIAALVARTTAPGELLKALRALGVPRTFVLVATMTERYILTLTTTIEEMHQALLSRRIRPLGGAASRAFVTSRMGVVFAKARATADEVHLAMISRGFRGEVRTLSRPRLRARDLAAVSAVVVLSVAVALAGRVFP